MQPAVQNAPGCRAFALALACLSAAGPLRAAERRPYGGTLEVAAPQEIASVDPISVSTEAELLLARQLHETLFRLDETGAPQPVLAQGLPTEESSGTLRLHLKPGLVFQDGSPCFAADVQRSFERLLQQGANSPHWWLLAPISGAVDFRRGKIVRLSGLEIVNPVTLRVKTALPSAVLVEALSAVPTAVLPSRSSGGTPGGGTPGGGAGPFRLEGTLGGQHLELVAEERHPWGRPFADRQSLRMFENAREAALGFELHRMHVSLVPLSNPSGDVVAHTSRMDRLLVLSLNPDRLAQKPPGFRQAVLDAIDRRSLSEYLVGALGRETDELLTSDEPAEALPTNPARARAYLIKLSPTPLGLPLILELIARRDRPLELLAAERIQVNLIDAGVSTILVPLGPAEFEARRSQGRFDLRLVELLPLARSPELQWLRIAALAERERGVEQALRALRELPRSGDRQRLVRERARAALAESPLIPLLTYRRQVYIHKAVRELEFDGLGVLDLAQAWIVR